jgi:hypothetical protein
MTWVSANGPMLLSERDDIDVHARRPYQPSAQPGSAPFVRPRYRIGLDVLSVADDRLRRMARESGW